MGDQSISQFGQVRRSATDKSGLSRDLGWLGVGAPMLFYCRRFAISFFLAVRLAFKNKSLAHFSKTQH
jgi:hypothetical protein